MLRKTIKAKLAPVRRPPLQLLMTSVSDDASALSAGTNSALSLVFELFPHHGRRYPRDARLCKWQCS